MKYEIVEQCQKSEIACTKSILTTTYACLIILYCFYIIKRIHDYNNKAFCFEQIPLLTTILQATMQLVLNAILMDTKLILSALYLQLLTFGIISFSCCELYKKTINSKKKYKKIRLKMLVYFALLLILCLSVLILTIFDVFKLDCDDWFSYAYLIPVFLMVFLFFICVYYGRLLIKKINKIKR